MGINLRVNVRGIQYSGVPITVSETVTGPGTLQFQCQSFTDGTEIYETSAVAMPVTIN